MTGFELSAYLGLPLLTVAIGWVVAAALKPQPAPIRVRARGRR